MKMELTKSEAERLMRLAENAAGPEMKALADKISAAVYPVRIINMLPHDVVVYGDLDQVVATFPGAGDGSARISLDIIDEEYLCGVPVRTREVAGYINLPEPQYNTFYIVSGLFARFGPTDRDDLLIVSGQVRDDFGRVIGCRGFEHL